MSFCVIIKKVRNKMDKRISCKGLYNLINNKELIASGSGANLYKYSNNSLFKFRAGYFAETLALDKEDMEDLSLSQIALAIQVKNANSNSFQYFKQKQKENDLRKVIKRGKFLRYSKTTNSMVFVDDICVGYILPYHKDMITLKDYLKAEDLQPAQKLQVYQNIERAINELRENFIYHPDLTLGNILVNPDTCETQIIDFEDDVVACDELYLPGELTYKRYLRSFSELLSASQKETEEKSV